MLEAGAYAATEDAVTALHTLHPGLLTVMGRHVTNRITLVCEASALEPRRAAARLLALAGWRLDRAEQQRDRRHGWRQPAAARGRVDKTVSCAPRALCFKNALSGSFSRSPPAKGVITKSTSSCFTPAPLFFWLSCTGMPEILVRVVGKKRTNW